MWHVLLLDLHGGRVWGTWAIGHTCNGAHEHKGQGDEAHG